MTLGTGKQKSVFELFGFDFILDEDFRVWLLEVNTNPYLGTPSEHLKKLVPQMLNDMMKIVLDPICPPRVVPDSHRLNGFELVYHDASREREGSGTTSVNKRRPFSLDLVYPRSQY